jgi:hypothetical protein
MRTHLRIFVLVMGAVTAVRADINISLDNPNQTGLPGATLQFFGTIANTSADTVFLNSDDINFTGGPSLSVNDLFFTNVPVLLEAGLTSGDIELFDVSLASPFTGAPGLYGGSYTLTGGLEPGSQLVLAATSFSVTVAATPEPGFFGVLALGIIGLLFASRRYRCT